MNFGKLSSVDLLIFLELSEQFGTTATETRIELAGKRAEFFAPDCASAVWNDFYELPILEHAQAVAELIGESDGITGLSQAEHPVQFIQEDLGQLDQQLKEQPLTPEDKDELRPRVAAVFGAVFSLTETFRSLVTFGYYLNEQVAAVRNRLPNAEKALLSAVKIDRTVLACPSINAYVSERVLINEEKFLRKLRRAENGKLTKREQRNYQQMRLVLQVLHETGAKKLSAAELHQLFVEELNLVAADRATDVGDVAENLRQFAYQFMKQKAVS